MLASTISTVVSGVTFFFVTVFSTFLAGIVIGAVLSNMTEGLTAIAPDYFRNMFRFTGVNSIADIYAFHEDLVD